ncbi:MAG: hypothetical protein Q7T73_20745 [Beijerinckiaceae bacterium]|nr:hypothetical protein [Beijerinckiaceae bacterium]
MSAEEQGSRRRHCSGVELRPGPAEVSKKNRATSDDLSEAFEIVRRLRRFN